MFVIFFRTIILYLFIIFGMRMMGKRQVGELQPNELVITLLISNVAMLPIEDKSVPMIWGVVPILILISLEVLISVAGLKFKWLRKLLSGEPCIIIKDGIVDQNMLRKLRYSIDDLTEIMRENDIFDIDEISYAIVETNGKVSFLKRIENTEATVGDLNLTLPEVSPQLVIISDGALIEQNLKTFGFDYKVVEKELEKRKLTLPEVFLMTVNKEKTFRVINKCTDKINF